MQERSSNELNNIGYLGGTLGLVKLVQKKAEQDGNHGKPARERRGLVLCRWVKKSCILTAESGKRGRGREQPSSRDLRRSMVGGQGGEAKEGRP